MATQWSNFSVTLSGDVDDLSHIGAAHSPIRAFSRATAELDRSRTMDQYSTVASTVMEPQASATSYVGPTSGVLPTFFSELAASAPVFQRLHLQMFEARLDDFLCYVGPDPELVTPKDWEGLLLHLHLLLQRRGGLTPLQAFSNDECSNAAFRILHRLICTTHASLARVRDAYVRVLAAVELTTEFVVNPDESTSIAPAPTTSGAIDWSARMQAEIADLDAQAAEAFAQEAAEIDAPSAAAADAAAAFAAEGSADPYFYTVDCLPESTVGLLTEAEFQRVEMWFAELNQVTPGRYAVTAGIQAGGGVLGGCRWLSPKALTDWTKLFPDGTATLADVLRFLFRATPAWVIQMRIEGSCLEPSKQERSDGSAQLTSAPPQRFARLPPAVAALRELEIAVAPFARPSDVPAAVACPLLRRLFDAADGGAVSVVSLAGIQAALQADASAPLTAVQAGCIDISAAFAAAQAARTARDGPVALTFPQFAEACLLSSATSGARQAPQLSAEAGGSDELAVSVEEASRVARWAIEERYAAAQRSAPPPEPKKPLKKLTVAQRVALRERHRQLLAEIAERRVVVLRRAAREHAHRRAIADLQKHELIRRQHDDAEAAKNVGVVEGPAMPPPTAVHGSGIEYTAKLFNLARFLEQPEFASDVVRWLHAVDAFGVHPDLLLVGSGRLASHVMPAVLSHPLRVYRDAAVASRRPAGKSF